MKKYFKLGFATIILALASGCATQYWTPVPVGTEYNHLDSSSFKALGRVIVTVDANASQTGVYETLIKKAQQMGGNDVINIYIDEMHGEPNQYRASGLVIKHR